MRLTTGNITFIKLVMIIERKLSRISMYYQQNKRKIHTIPQRIMLNSNIWDKSN
jgi:hypothetical protein